MTIYTLIYCVPVLRIAYSSSLCIHTMSRRISLMFPWTTVGTPVPSSFSPVRCVRKVDESLRTLPTKPAQMIKCTALFSSVPLKSLICPSKDLWR